MHRAHGRSIRSFAAVAVVVTRLQLRRRSDPTSLVITQEKHIHDPLCSLGLNHRIPLRCFPLLFYQEPLRKRID